MSGGYNGGGTSGNQGIYNGSGGGSSDIRLVSGDWNDFESLKSRIMVAGAGGGASYYQSNNHNYGSGGAGGGLIGYDSEGPVENYNRIAGGGTQTGVVYDKGEVPPGFGYAGATDTSYRVTGGGGSIGSELCRQIAKCKPETLIIFDIYENNAYDIQQELLRNYPDAMP